MKTLNIPKKNTIKDVELALTLKNGKYKYKLNASEVNIIESNYKKYDKLLGNPHDNFKSNLLSPDCNIALENAYNEVQLGRRLEVLRKKLLSIDYCPYCGVSPADELDHYLPRSIYKSLSVYSRNLIPICHTCNNKKRTAFSSKNNNNTFFHAYFEVFPNTAFFKIKVELIGNELNIQVYLNNNNISSVLKDKLLFQIGRTDLEKRIKREINKYLFDQKIPIELIFSASGKKGLIDLINKQYLSSKKNEGLNHWKTAFLYSLKDSNSFCNGGFIQYYKKRYK